MNQYMDPYNQQVPVTIRKLILVETGDYKDQYIRPFDVNVSYEALNAIEDIVHHTSQIKSTEVKPDAIAKAAPDIMMPSANVLGRVDIPYGWREKRLRFLLEATHPAPGGYGELVTVLQGYTEYFGISTQSQALDERMRFFVNSVLILNRQVDHTGRLIARVVKHMDVVHLPGGGMEVTDYSHQYTLNTPDLLVCRPEDITTCVGTRYDMDAYNVDVVPAGVLASPVDTRKDLVLPTKHIAMTLTGILKSRLTTEISYDKVDVYDQASSYIKSPTRLDSEFFNKLAAVKGMNIDNTFTIADLRRIDPNVDNVTEAYIGSNVAIDQNPMLTTDTEDLHTRSLENRLAVLIAEGMSGLLAENMLTTMHFSVSNVTGEPVVGVKYAASIIDGLDPVMWAERAKVKFMELLWPTISANNMMMVNLDVVANLLSDTFVTISINGNPEVIFRIPTFASATFNPLVMNKVQFDTTVDNYKKIIDIATL